MWALARWLNAGTDRHPYLVPVEPPHGLPVADRVAADAMRAAVFTSEINEAVRLMWIDVKGDEP